MPAMPNAGLTVMLVIVAFRFACVAGGVGFDGAVGELPSPPQAAATTARTRIKANRDEYTCVAPFRP